MKNDELSKPLLNNVRSNSSIFLPRLRVFSERSLTMTFIGSERCKSEASAVSGNTTRHKSEDAAKHSSNVQI